MSAAIDYSIVGRSLMHPLQQKILDLLVGRVSDGLGQLDASPNELSKLFEESVGNVSYHFKALKDRGWVKCTREEPRRGAMEHFYRLTGELVTS